MNARKKLVISVVSLLVIAVVIVLLLWFTYKEMKSYVFQDQLPVSTLEDMPWEHIPVALDESVYQTELECPTFPYSVYLPCDNYQIKNDAVVFAAADREISFLLEESALDVETFIKNSMGKLGVTIFVTPDALLETHILEDGYIHGFKASYWVGSVSVKNAIFSQNMYGVAYKLYDGKTPLYLAGFCRNDADIQVVKAYLDEIISGMYKKDNAAVEDKEPDTDADNEENTVPDAPTPDSNVDALPVVGEKTTIYDEDYESYLNKTSEGISLLPISFGVSTTEPVEDAVLVFEWMNIGTRPVELYVVKPDESICYYDEEDSYSGMYAYYLGDIEKGNYMIKGTTAVTLEGCLFYICDMEYYRDQVLHIHTDEEE